MDELLGRRVPHSQEAEQSILGAMLIDPACVPDVVNRVRAAEFYFDVNREIFETIFSMFSLGQSVDPVTVLDEMKTRGCWKENSRQYLIELMDVTPTAANVLEYCAIVRDRALLRDLGTSATEITDLVYGGTAEAEQALEFAERKIYALRKENTTGGLVPLTQILPDMLKSISAASQGGNRNPGVTTGLTDIDDCLMGMQPGDFILIASRPGMGKTSIALNMAVSAATSMDKAVAVFSLEMSRQQLAMRLLSSESKIDSYSLTRGSLGDTGWQALATAAGDLSRLRILIDDNPSMTVAEMSAQCRRVDDLGLIVVDYLQLMQSSGSGRSWANESRTQAVSDISRMMKVTAKELGVPIVCLSQLSRANEGRTNKRPMLSDLRESGSIEQDADAVIGLYREGYYNPDCEDPTVAEAIILKNRRGRVGTIYLRWLPEYTKYVSDERKHTDNG